MKAAAALVAFALAVLPGCTQDSCDDENDCPPRPDAASAGGSGGSTGGSGGSTGGSGGSTGGGGGSTGGSSGSTGSGGTGGTAGGMGGSGMDASPDLPAIELPAPPATCAAMPAERHPGAPVHTVTVKPTIAGKAVELGEPVVVGTTQVTITQLRFFVTQPTFVRAGAAPVPAQLVDAAGKPLPYDLALVDLDKPDSLTLRLRAPAGDYDRLSLSIGVYPACNTTQPAALVYPLNPSGGMTWTWTTGYIFFFLEGGRGAGVPAKIAAHGGIYPPGTGAVPLAATGSFGRPASATVLEARLDQLVEVVDSENHLEGGRNLMSRLPTADFWRVATP